MTSSHEHLGPSAASQNQKSWTLLTEWRFLFSRKLPRLPLTGGHGLSHGLVLRTKADRTGAGHLSQMKITTFPTLKFGMWPKEDLSVLLSVAGAGNVDMVITE